MINRAAEWWRVW